MKSMLDNLKKELRAHADLERAKTSAWFFKTAKGQYGEGDKFLGLTMPMQRKIVAKYQDLSFVEIEKLLNDPYHEMRMAAVLVLVSQFTKGDKEQQKSVFDFYLAHAKQINNWDLVDVSAGYIVGGFLNPKNIDILTKLAHSKNLWERRISIIATFYFIKNKQHEPTFKIAEILLTDKEDLIHKATGWMLREVGKRCGQETEEIFLKKHAPQMPRTMLRYSLERFVEEERKKYLSVTKKI
jgi:3-methyladenine DNA glycosylase AlkD